MLACACGIKRAVETLSKRVKHDDGGDESVHDTAHSKRNGAWQRASEMEKWLSCAHMYWFRNTRFYASCYGDYPIHILASFD